MKVLVSACLCGIPCRYDGGSSAHRLVDRLCKAGMAEPVCPETAGGLPIPRTPCEIVGGRGSDVWDGKARVVTRDGLDVTDAFKRGAQAALAAAQRCGASAAIMTERSPSCGVEAVHDGSFSGLLRRGEGVTTAYLRQNGICVYSHENPDLEALLGPAERRPGRAQGE